jgi:hypothetical protein
MGHVSPILLYLRGENETMTLRIMEEGRHGFDLLCSRVC